MVADLTPVWGEREASAISNLAFEHLTGLTFYQLVAQPALQLSLSQQSALQNIVRHLLGHKPIQYVLGETEFYGYRLKLNPSVLIPRPETEELVRWIITDYPDAQSALDIGTGSGCIAIALGKELNLMRVVATDVSDAALEVARQNARLHHIAIELHQHNALAHPFGFGPERFDIVVSNPPYVRESERAAMQPNVLDFEPALALFVPDHNPLLFYRAVAIGALPILSEQGALYLEINENLANEMHQLLMELGFAHVTIRKDLSGKHRMVKAQPNNTSHG